LANWLSISDRAEFDKCQDTKTPLNAVSFRKAKETQRDQLFSGGINTQISLPNNLVLTWARASFCYITEIVRYR